ncbi:MAG: fluoride efflux transporter CrcB [Pontixanthobacter sp.]
MSTISPLAATANVALGGAIGAALRYQIGRMLTGWLGAPAMSAFPWATLFVNVVGSMAMGLLVGGLAGESGIGSSSDQWRLLIGVGLLGGFTTFSSFSLELMVLIERGDIAAALSYAFISVVSGLTGLYIGLIAMRVMT